MTDCHIFIEQISLPGKRSQKFGMQYLLSENLVTVFCHHMQNRKNSRFISKGDYDKTLFFKGDYKKKC